MKWSSVILTVVIVTLYDSGFKADSETNCLNHIIYYVTPRLVGCVNDQVPCQTMEQYAT